MTSDAKPQLGTNEPGTTGPKLHCSFCGKSQDQVRKLIAGPNVQICDECVELCNEILEREAEADSPPMAAALHTIASCSLCRLPKDLAELRIIAEKGVLCVECIDTVRSVAESGDRGDGAT